MTAPSSWVEPRRRKARVPLTVVVVALAAPAAIAVVIAVNAGHHHSPPVKTLPPAAGAAATEFRQVATDMEVVAGYHFSGSVRVGPRSISISGEFAAPNRLHETLTASGAPPIERILVGSTTYQRNATGWAATGGTPSADPRGTFAALEAATSVTAVAGGYDFTLEGTAAASLVSGAPGATVTGTVHVQAGTITDVSYTSNAGPGTAVHFSYDKVGATATITAPPSTVR